MWKQIPTGSLERMPREKRSLPNMQEDRPFRKTVQIRNATTPHIQTTTTSTKNEYNSTPTGKVQPSGTKTDTTKN